MMTIPSGKGRTQKDGATLFLRLTHDDQCVTTVEDILRLNFPRALEPEIKRLLESTEGFKALKLCICDRRGNYAWPSGYLTQEGGKCDEVQLQVLKKGLFRVSCGIETSFV